MLLLLLCTSSLLFFFPFGLQLPDHIPSLFMAELRLSYPGALGSWVSSMLFSHSGRGDNSKSM